MMVLNKRLHKYLGLEGEYEVSYPTEVITRDIRNLRMDSLYETNLNQLNNIEAQSTSVLEKEMKRFATYRIFAEYMYNMALNTIIIITVDPKNSLKEYKISETDILKPIYIFIPPEKIIEKFKNIVSKVENNEKLSESETLDIAFLPLFAPNNQAKEMTEMMCTLIKKDRQIPYELKRDISFILQIMIFKHVKYAKERENLLKMINMNKFKSDLEIIAYELYGDELEEKIEKINQKNNELNQKNNELNQKNNELNQKNDEINQYKLLLTEIKEKNNLDKTTLEKINAVLNL